MPDTFGNTSPDTVENFSSNAFGNMFGETVGAWDAWERPDLREELVIRLRDAVTRQRIADALITEAEGGPPDLKSGQPKGGATVVRAFELIREIALERPPDDSAAALDFSAYSDAELAAMLSRLTDAAPGDYG